MKKLTGFAIQRGIVKAVTLFASETDAVKVAAQREGTDGYMAKHELDQARKL